MYRIAICDDDANMRTFIKTAVQKSGISCKTAEFTDGVQLTANYVNWDILFLDIDMPRLNGIDTADVIRRLDKRVKIIYVTGYAEYIHRSFSVHPFSFLVKPVSDAEIIKQLEEAVHYEFIANAGKDREERLKFHTDKGAQIFAVSDIYYLEYQNRKILMVTKRGTYSLKGRITEIASHMMPYGFACPHKSFSVNLYYVKSIKGYDIHMVNGDLIPLSQKRSAEFRNVLGNFQADFI